MQALPESVAEGPGLVQWRLRLGEMELGVGRRVALAAVVAVAAAQPVRGPRSAGAHLVERRPACLHFFQVPTLLGRAGHPGRSSSSSTWCCEQQGLYQQHVHGLHD